jgi:hypothetical protein
MIILISTTLFVIGIISLFNINPSSYSSDREIIAMYNQNKEVIYELKSLILEEDISSIGDDNVGDYWFHNNRWTTHKPPYEKSLETEMLVKVGLSENRYDYNLGLLKELEAYRITKTIEGDKIISINIHLHRTSIVTSNRTISIVYSPYTKLAGPNSEDTFKCTSNFQKKTCYSYIENNWYIEHTVS